MKASPAVSLLLTNLQLLDYYASDDAFPISTETFTSLKNKGKAFEHIVHHLFQVYQPVEAVARFQACWPIYEPIQSKELRNIAFKWLTDLKKAGLLQTGGNVIIRRSLFDECCGERYEELLLALSTMVLRNHVERRIFHDKKKQTIAYKQCTTHNPSLGLLTPLTLAHQSSLTRLLASRNASKTQWAIFWSLLKQREADLLQVSSQLPPEPIVSSDTDLKDDDIISKWTNNWLGDDRWLNILVKGDSEFYKDKLLEMSLEKALAKHHLLTNDDRVEKTSRNVLPLAGLKALETQVEEQKRRVCELRIIREEALKSLGDVKAKSQDIVETEGDVVPKNCLQVTFNRHTDLNISSVVPEAPLNISSSNEYSVPLENLRAELQAVDSGKRRRRPRPILTPFHPHSLQDEMDVEFKIGSQGTAPRKTHLPQPKTKLPIPSIAPLTATMTSASTKGDVFEAQNKSDTSPMNDQHGNVQPKAISRGAEEAQECRSPPQRKVDQVERMTTNKRSTTTNPALLSPLSLPPPSTRLRITPESPSKSRGKAERPLGTSSVWSHDPINDVDQDSVTTSSTTPERRRNPERGTERSTQRSPGSTSERRATEPNVLYTPQSKNKLPSDDSDDNQMTPKPKPRRLLKPAKSSGFQLPDNTELFSEDIVSKVTNSNYSPEQSTPVRKTISSPTKINRFGFGFRSPEVSPIRFQSPGFNVLEHSALLSLASPGSSSPNTNRSPLRYPKAGLISSPESVNNERTADQLQLNLDPLSTSLMSPLPADITPKEELFASEDYNSVFKSRPRIALSPGFAPISQPSGIRHGLVKGRYSPEFISLNSAASASGSEDGDSTRSFGGTGFGSASVQSERSRVGRSRIPAPGRRK